MDLSNLLIPAVLFFALGFIAQAVRSDLKFPPELAKALSIYLLIGIGLKGGIELSHADMSDALNAVTAALVLGFSLPIIAYAILLAGRLDKLNASAIAAHYGSVSAGTFLTAIAYMNAQEIAYESYPVIMLAIMESPAIIVGLLLARFSRGSGANEDDARENHMGELLRDAFTNGSVMLLFGAMFIGLVVKPDSLATITPFFSTLFMGVLSLFLLEMGMEAGKRISEFRRAGLFLVSFGVVMPLIGAAAGILVGHYWLGFSEGGVLLVAVLGASASYIAVPPAMRLAIPEANPSFYLTLSLGVTFPFNVLVGIPLYHYLITRLTA
ncbi:sodium-dependent bicarbonate transport family permease [Oceanibaculum nanhaiense]|uniref:sodium-dependent bicarbonate transport family permease n=1 Tax=Oceanibaculum nanhaiense TaxID=1909734 RepID=UPI00396E0EB1